MAVLFLVVFALGAVLAGVASARLFIAISLILLVVGLAEGIHIGWAISQAGLVVIGGFISGQLGYVFGVGVWSLIASGSGRVKAAPKPDRLSEEEFKKPSAAPLKGGQQTSPPV